MRVESAVVLRVRRGAWLESVVVAHVVCVGSKSEGKAKESKVSAVQ